jgi:hypothetical protein
MPVAVVAFILIGLVGAIGLLTGGGALMVAPRRCSRVLNHTFALPVIGPRNRVGATIARLFGLVMIVLAVQNAIGLVHNAIVKLG